MSEKIGRARELLETIRDWAKGLFVSEDDVLQINCELPTTTEDDE